MEDQRGQMIALEVQAVHQWFRQGFWMRPFEVLKEISFQVTQGSIFGLLGPNGAGKTTLIHLMVGLCKPKQGLIRVGHWQACQKEAKKQVGYLPERPYFHEFLTADRFLRYYGRLAGMQASEIEERIPEVLQQVEMQEARFLELKRYSKGMLQRIGIAQALIHRPSLLVLDEPMSGLDPLGRHKLQEILVHFAKEGGTVFFSSHNWIDVQSVCDRLAWIQKGKLLKQSSVLEASFLGIEIIFRMPSQKALHHRVFEMQTQVFDRHKVMVADQKALDEALPWLLDQGAQVLSIQPVSGFEEGCRV